MAISRRPVREALAVAMDVAITEATAVYDHKPTDLGGATPVLAIESVSSERPVAHFGGLMMLEARFRFIVHIFVRRPDSSSSWTKAQADDQLDDLEAAVATFVEENQQGERWDGVTISGGTVIDDNVVIDGKPYINEQILIEVSPR